MATSSPQDDYMKTALRLPRDLHAKIQEAAVASGKSLNSELIARLESSFGQRADLSQVLVRLERDLARAEFESEAGRFRTGFVSSALLALTNGMPPEARLPGDPQRMNAKEWRDFAAAMVEQSKGVTKRLYELIDQIKVMESRVQSSSADSEIDAQLPEHLRYSLMGGNAAVQPPSTTPRPPDGKTSRRTKP